MYKFKHILTGLNLNESDSDLINFTGRVAVSSEAQEVLFVHIVDGFEIPAVVVETFPSLAPHPSPDVVEKLRMEIRESLPENTPFEIKFDARKGRQLHELLLEIHSNNIDLLIVGRKLRHERKSLKLAERLARKAPCSVLVVPEGSHTAVKTILVTTDFSDHSVMAMEEAVSAARSFGISEIFCATVYHVPNGYSSTGKSYEEFAKIMLDNAVIEYEEFIGRCNLGGIRVDPIYELNDHITDGVHSVVDRISPDLVVVGARGRSQGAAIILGSVTEHLLENIDVPILAVKNKDDGMKLLDVIING